MFIISTVFSVSEVRGDGYVMGLMWNKKNVLDLVDKIFFYKCSFFNLENKFSGTLNVNIFQRILLVYEVLILVSN